MPPRAASAVKKIILIVEDDMMLALSVKDFLEDGGYEVLELADRHLEALAIAREAKPNLALVNIDLAGGDDGVALAGDLQALGVPVMFISGNADRMRDAKGYAIAALPKPYPFRDLVSAVDYLFRHAAGDESRPGPRQLQVFQ